MNLYRRAIEIISNQDFLSKAMLIGLLLFGLSAHAEALRDKVVAGFVFNFIKFTEWPDLPAGAPINLCVASSREMFSVLNGFSGKTVIGHRLQVTALNAPSLRQCQVFFIGQGSALECDCDCHSAFPKMLSISDNPGFAGNCGMIGLYEENEQLRFEVNLDNVERSAIRLSSKLLRLARIVRENEP